jgi:hypothetical protein
MLRKFAFLGGLILRGSQWRPWPMNIASSRNKALSVVHELAAGPETYVSSFGPSIADKDRYLAVEVGLAPTETYLRQIAVLSNVLLEAARRCADTLPGLYEVLQDKVVVTSGGSAKRALGWFRRAAWRYADRRLDEVFVNADRSGAHPGTGAAEDVLVTLLHEACHVYAQANGVQDTSREGRYHNRRFGELAVAIGLTVVRNPVIGHETPGLVPWARETYADLLAELEDGLVLAREPATMAKSPGGGVGGDVGVSAAAAIGSASSSRYVFACCNCAGARSNKVTIRIARGSWRPETIRCSVCDAWFDESPSS